MIFNSPERIAALTPLNQYERTADGRPRVPDEILERMRRVTNDEAWGVVEREHDYHFQFEGNWVNLHPERVLVGRAVTVRMVPLRPDLQGVVEGMGTAEGRSGGQNTWVIDMLLALPFIVFALAAMPAIQAAFYTPREAPSPFFKMVTLVK